MNKPLLTTYLLLFAGVSAFAKEGLSKSHMAANRLTSGLSSSIKTSKEAGPITGTVKDDTGYPLPGVSIKLKGSTAGTITNSQGIYTVNANAGDVLVFSFIGYAPKEVTVGGGTILNVVLESTSKGLNEVVVTALGIKRSEKSLVYATQTVSNADLTTVKSDNLINALDGKVAGVNVTPSAGGIGNGTKVILRGQRSVSGNNQPLYVIDGVPISNSGIINMGTPNGTYGGSPDPGDGISNLNADDIESLTILKGASAAALYGSSAANGVILITTKKGKAGKTTISVNSLTSITTTAYRPKFQNDYQQGTNGIADTTSETSWGPKASFAVQDNLKKFFQVGVNLTNSITLSGGNETAQTYFSYANTTSRGIEPTNKLQRNNLDIHETAKFLHNKLSVDGNINYLTQELDNNPNIGFYNNPLTGLYFFPRNRDITFFKDHYKGPLQANGSPSQNWSYNDDQQQNPWWIINKEVHVQKRTRTLVNVSAKYDFAPWISLQARGTVDHSSDLDDLKQYSGIKAPFAGGGNGIYSGTQGEQLQKYADAILSLQTVGNSAFKADGVIGTSIQDNSQSGINWNSGGPGQGLFIPDVFIIQNIEAGAANSANPVGNTASTLAPNHNQIQAVFASANLSYKDWIYLALTARNDWSSNLAFTPTDHYFYPSAGLSLILSQVLKLPTAISYLKVRGTYAAVGNTVQQYSTLVINGTSANAISINTQAPYPGLKPEQTKSTEVGIDARFLGDRLSLTASYYESNTYHQSIAVSPPQTTGYSSGFLNAGNIQNKGFEFLINWDVFRGKDFNWSTAINGSRNVNRIIDLDEAAGIVQVNLTGDNSYQSVLQKGGKFGDIWGQSLAKDAQGRIIVTASDGSASANTPTVGNFSRIANATPKFQGGWNNTLNYKNVSLAVLIDGKFGGEVVSVSQQQQDFFGVTKETGDARNAGGVKVNAVDVNGNAVGTIDAQKYYQVSGGRNGTLGSYVYDATVVHLRQVALGYTFPFKNAAVKSLKLSLTGNNLLYIYKKAPFDPDLTSSTGNGLSGVDVFNMPAFRTFGFNLNVTF